MIIFYLSVIFNIPIRPDYTTTIKPGIIDKQSHWQTYNVMESYIHPNYSRRDYWQKHNDIALIKVDRDMDLHVSGNHWVVNGICLPEPDIVNTGYELAQFAGFGPMEGRVSTQKLRIGWTRIIEAVNDTRDRWETIIWALRYPKLYGSGLCHVI